VLQHIFYISWDADASFTLRQPTSLPKYDYDATLASIFVTQSPIIHSEGSSKLQKTFHSKPFSISKLFKTSSKRKLYKSNWFSFFYNVEKPSARTTRRRELTDSDAPTTFVQEKWIVTPRLLTLHAAAAKAASSAADTWTPRTCECARACERAGRNCSRLQIGVSEREKKKVAWLRPRDGFVAAKALAHHHLLSLKKEGLALSRTEWKHM